jgi:hypothetical protein
MADKDPARAISVIKRVATMCDFIDHPVIKTAVEQAVPVSMPRAVGALGFDIPHWVGLGLVSLWATLDAFAERASLPRTQCKTCGSRGCIQARFADHVQGNESSILAELEDLRHLYAHNYAGEADDKYFDPKHTRHVLARGKAALLTCGATFDGRAQLNLTHLRMYSRSVQTVLERFP